MKYFIDVQYHAYQKSVGGIFNRRSITVTDVIGVGIVDNSGRSLHIINKDFDLDKAWGDYKIREGVLKPMYCDWFSSDVNFFDIKKEDIAMLVRAEGVSFRDMGIDIKMFLNDGNVGKEFYFLDNGAWNVFCDILGGVQLSYRRSSVDELIKEFAKSLSYGQIAGLIGKALSGYLYSDKYDTLISSTNIPTRDVLKKTAMTEARLCKDRYEYLEGLKGKLADIKKKNAECIEIGAIKKKMEEEKFQSELNYLHDEARLDFIANYKAELDCLNEKCGTKVTDINIAEQRLGTEMYDYFISKLYGPVTRKMDGLDITHVRCRQFEEDSIPPRPKVDVESTIPREEIISEIKSSPIDINKEKPVWYFNVLVFCDDGGKFMAHRLCADDLEDFYVITGTDNIIQSNVTHWIDIHSLIQKQK